MHELEATYLSSASNRYHHTPETHLTLFTPLAFHSIFKNACMLLFANDNYENITQLYL